MSDSENTVLTDFERDYAQEDLRFQVIGMLGLLLQDRKARGTSSQAKLAERLGVDKGQISRWLKSDTNMTLNTVADLARALDANIEFAVRDRESGTLYHQDGIHDSGEYEMIDMQALEGSKCHLSFVKSGSVVISGMWSSHAETNYDTTYTTSQSAITKAVVLDAIPRDRKTHA